MTGTRCGALDLCRMHTEARDTGCISGVARTSGMTATQGSGSRLPNTSYLLDVACASVRCARNGSAPNATGSTCEAL